MINLRIASILFLVLIGVFIGMNIPFVPFSHSLTLLAGVLICGLTLLEPGAGLVIIIFSMLLSPEFKIGAVSGRDVVVRIEDILLGLVTFTWLVKTAVNKELGLFRRSPLNVPIAVYIFVCVVSTAQGIFFGHVKPFKGLFYLLKYVEYFLLYFMVFNQVRTRRQIRLFVIALFVTCAVICIYASLHIGTQRATAPFEGPGEGEPNTLGGYLLFMAAMSIGIALHAHSARTRLWLWAFVLFLILPVFLHTLSRTSYLSIIPMWIALIIFGPKKWIPTFMLLLAILVGTFYQPLPVRQRIQSTFTAERSQEVKPVVIGDIQLDSSASARIRSWVDVWEEWPRSFVFGYGVGRGLIDGQYLLVIHETGLAGLLAFLFLLWGIFTHSRQVLRSVEDRFLKGLSLGFLAGFSGLFFFNMGASGFILIRIMEPFWFMAAMVMSFPRLSHEGEMGSGSMDTAASEAES